MRHYAVHWPILCWATTMPKPLLNLLGALLLALCCGGTEAAPTEDSPAQPAVAGVSDSFGDVTADEDAVHTTLSNSPVDAEAYVPRRAHGSVLPADFQSDDSTSLRPHDQPLELTAAAQAARPAAKDPCAAAQFKPLSELGIGIAQPAGKLPTDFATPCWNQINAGPTGAFRCWGNTCYQWDATCLCYRPLYFEEVNAERYGYICGCCLQPLASAAHFFGTVPALPYYMAADCPCECVYSLGHYRPGNCVPGRCHWPPCDPVAMVSSGGIYTGLIFAIP